MPSFLLAIGAVDTPAGHVVYVVADEDAVGDTWGF